MKRKYAPLFPLMLLALSFAPAARSQGSPAAVGSPSSPIISTALEKMPLMFIANQGQFDPEVFFVLKGRDKTLFFTAGGVTLVLSEPRPAPASALQRAALREDRDPRRQWAARLEFAGADPGVVPQGRRRVSTVFSYFKGTPNQWRTAVPAFEEIVYAGLWPGVDLVFKGTAENRVKYAFIVHSGADPGRIRLAFQGAEIAPAADGGLRVDTPLGGFTDPAQLAWQGEGASRLPVACAYEPVPAASDQGRAYGFRLGAYDPSRTLVVDPEFIVYSGFLGGGGNDVGRGIAVDGAGQAYVTGQTFSADFPRTVGAAYAGGSDVFVAKIRLHWDLYIPIS